MMKHQLEHPYAWLNLDALDQNIQFVNENSGTKKIRIATKSVRSVDVLKYIEKHLHNSNGFMTFTAAETVYLANEGLNHFLIGYPTMEAHTVRKLLQMQQTGLDVTFMIDHEKHLEFLQHLASEMNCHVQVCIDINVSVDYKVLYFGSKRSPLSNKDRLLYLLAKVKKYPSIRIVGAMGYDAQIAGIGDHPSSIVKRLFIPALKKQSEKKVSVWRKQAVHLIKQNNRELQFVNGGGSGSIQYTAKQSEVTEVTVGSAFFAPALFDTYHNLALTPSVGFALRVVRQFDEETFVLQGGGYIASGAIGADRLPQFVEQSRFTFLPLEGAGEVQTPILDANKSLNIGDTVFLRHAKAGELCERFLTLHGVRGTDLDIYERPFSTYRGDGQCFL